jgi:hypothetical protein
MAAHCRIEGLLRLQDPATATICEKLAREYDKLTEIVGKEGPTWSADSGATKP